MTELGARTGPGTEGTGLLVVPLGATEQHGPHLPVDTDTRIAAAMAAEMGEVLQAERGDVVVAPPVPYGASGEHQDFSGTLSIGTDALVTLLVELVRSASCWTPAVVFINGHGGNVEAVTRAVTQLVGEGRAATWIPALTASDVSGGLPADAHAGALETSVMLHLHPDLVQLDRAPAGTHTPLHELMPLLRRDGLAAHAPDGVLGNPQAASAQAGAETWEEAVLRCAHTALLWASEVSGADWSGVDEPLAEAAGG